MEKERPWSHQYKLIETVYHLDGETKVTEKGFNSKNEIVKLLKKYIPITSKTIYELTKHDEVFFEYGGLKRKLEIVKDE